jgi:hypothetical protein
VTETVSVNNSGGLNRLAEHGITRWALSLLPLPARRELLFIGCHRRFGNFTHPKTFSEKVNWRIIHDRRELLAWTCDKLRTKEVAKQRGVRVLPVLWCGTDAEGLRMADLPAAWVLKPNNRSGCILFGDAQSTSEAEVRRVLAMWSSDTWLAAQGEWAYARAAPGYFIEPRIGPIPGSPPDFKVFMFDGEPYMVQMDTDRFTGHRRRFYSPDWEPMPFVGAHATLEEAPRPECLADILDAGRIMAADFDFLRVDVFVEEGQVYLGEVTPYPMGGLEPFHPSHVDLEIGAAWSLPPL